jgi:hypothetical protein
MTQKTPEIGKHARAQIAETLPLAIDKAIASYHEFIDNKSSEESSDFKNRHTAAKAALAHIELLMKLAGMVDLDSDERNEHVAVLLQKAKAEFDDHE